MATVAHDKMESCSTQAVILSPEKIGKGWSVGQADGSTSLTMTPLKLSGNETSNKDKVL